MLEILLALPPLRPKEGLQGRLVGWAGHGEPLPVAQGAMLWWSSRLEWKPCQSTRIREVRDLNLSRQPLLILTEGESLLCLCSHRERHPSCLTYLWVIFRGRERWQGKEGTSSPVLLTAQAGLAPSPQLLSSLGADPCRQQQDPSTSSQGCCDPPAANLGRAAGGLLPPFLKLWVRFFFFFF